MKGNFSKIINTTYKLLDSFPDNDPLKYKAEEKTLKILENLTLISGASGWASLQKEKAGAELLDDIEILKNYLQLGKCQGWINGVNFLILLKEYDDIKSQIRPIESVPTAVGTMSPQAEQFNKVNHPTEVVGLGLQLKDKQNLPTELLRNNIPLTYEKIKKIDEEELKKASNYSEKQNQPFSPSLPEITDDQDKTSIRQKKILQILADREKTQVSDIIKEIPGITKRTIRRDLDNLLKNGKIVRMGEFNQIFYKKVS